LQPRPKNDAAIKPIAIFRWRINGFIISEIETEILRARRASEFSHPMSPELTSAIAEYFLWITDS
jgi:hypothetical protein